eukprot:2876387-Pleurochrysis_carterae.AAC.1
MASEVGSLRGKPRSLRSARRYTASLVASLAATISASHDESATVACFFDDHDIAAWLYVNTKPEVECRVAQSESVNPTRSLSGECW